MEIVTKRKFLKIMASLSSGRFVDCASCLVAQMIEFGIQCVQTHWEGENVQKKFNLYIYICIYIFIFLCLLFLACGHVRLCIHGCYDTRKQSVLARGRLGAI